MDILVNKIKVKKRVRKDEGNIQELAKSIKDNGQLHPIVITQNYTLVSGFRRYTAIKALGWEYIKAEIIENLPQADLLRIELEENTTRKDFTRDELYEGLKKLEKISNPPLIIRIFKKIGAFFKGLFTTS